jgi:regulator of protease activity HflC (stomatin/prohibitin superfamily)
MVACTRWAAVFEKLFEFVAQFGALFQAWTIVDPYEGGVVLRLGIYHRDLKPGFNWLIPLKIERVITEHTVPRTSRIHAMSTDTKDGTTIGFEAVVTWKINDIRKSLLEVSALKDAIADCCMGVIGTELSESTWEEIRHGKTMDALGAACRKQGWKWGVEIIRVQLTGVARAKNIRLLQDQYSMGLTVDTHGSEP